MNRINGFLRKHINRKNLSKLTNRDFSLIASNCNGTFMIHDLGLEYKSPFVNLWIRPEEFIRLLSDLPQYLNTPLDFIKEDNISYPIGLLKDVRIYFQHYASETAAQEAWNRRLKRVNYENLFVLFTDRDGCTYEDLKRFDSLPYPNKIVFTHKPFPEFESAFYLHGFEKDSSVGMCFEFKHPFTGKRIYDDFDYIAWFNSTKRK